MLKLLENFINVVINVISVISTNNKLVFIIIFVIDDISIYKTFVVKSILYLISLIQLGERMRVERG